MNEFTQTFIIISIFLAWLAVSLYAINFWFSTKLVDLKEPIHKSKRLLWWYGNYVFWFLVICIALGFVAIFTQKMTGV